MCLIYLRYPFQLQEQTDKASRKIGVCPRVVAMDKPGKNARVPVRILNMSSKVMAIPQKSFHYKK